MSELLAPAPREWREQGYDWVPADLLKIEARLQAHDPNLFILLSKREGCFKLFRHNPRTGRDEMLFAFVDANDQPLPLDNRCYEMAIAADMQRRGAPTYEDFRKAQAARKAAEEAAWQERLAEIAAMAGHAAVKDGLTMADSHSMYVSDRDRKRSGRKN